VSTRKKPEIELGVPVQGTCNGEPARVAFFTKEAAEAYGFQVKPAASGDPPQSAREFRDRVRDNYVLRVVGAGLDTRAEYDEPAIMDAYASECVKRERERCSKIAREYADDTGDIGLEPSKSEFDRGWLKASTRIHATIERGEG